MKKIFTFLFLSFFLTSCSLFSGGQPLNERFVDIEEPQNQIQKELEGVVKLKKYSVENKSTHILVDENDELIAEIKSKTVPLVEYQGEKVVIKGKLEKSFKDTLLLEVIEITEIEEEEEELNSEEETEITWKTFHHPEDRFSFEYPNIWNIVLAKKVLYIKDAEKDEELVQITRLTNPNNANLENFVKADSKEVTVNEQVALKVLKDDNLFDLYFSAPKEVIKIATLKDTLEYNEDFYKFLDTFIVSEEIAEVQKCGGSENLLCPEGYRCELNSAGINGTCVSLKSEENEYTEFGQESKEKISSSSPLINGAGGILEEKADIFENVEDLYGAEYDNTFLSFSLQYPKSWWFKSFGADDNSLWHIEFGKKEIENIGDGIIIVDVKNGARGKVLVEEGEKIQILLPRDSDSHFELTGWKDETDTLKEIAKTIQNNL